MPTTQSLSFEAFTAILAANGYAPDQGKLRALYAVLPTIEALQQQVRHCTADIALEPSHIFVAPNVTAGSETEK